MRFQHHTVPQRVRFATGGAAEGLAAEVERLDARALMVIAGPSSTEVARQITHGLPVAVWHDDVVMHVPVDVVRRATKAATAQGADLVVSIGGGSATGLAKAVALDTGLPIVAVPTTYAGSEATDVWGTTDGNRKTTGTDPRALPRAIVYDAALTLTLPVELSVASGINALAHCVDAMWGPRVDPIDQTLAGEGIRALRTGLPRIVADPAGLEGRELALYGAYLAAVAFASAGSGLHHKICHALGGMFDLPHAQTHAVVLPHVTALNAAAAPEAEQRIAAAFGADSAIAGLDELRRTVGAPTALRDYGMPEPGIAEAVLVILENVPAGNPAEVTEENLTRLLHDAWEGAPVRGAHR